MLRKIEARRRNSKGQNEDLKSPLFFLPLPPTFRACARPNYS
jgi:hypothetical protein